MVRRNPFNVLSRLRAIDEKMERTELAAARSAQMPYLIVHEFGHAFAGLADAVIDQDQRAGPEAASEAGWGGRSARSCQRSAISCQQEPR